AGDSNGVGVLLAPSHPRLHPSAFALLPLGLVHLLPPLVCGRVGRPQVDCQELLHSLCSFNCSFVCLPAASAARQPPPYAASLKSAICASKARVKAGLAVQRLT